MINKNYPLFLSQLAAQKSGQVNEALWLELNDTQTNPSDLPGKLYAFLVARGYSGSLQDMMKQWEDAGFPFDTVEAPVMVGYKTITNPTVPDSINFNTDLTDFTGGTRTRPAAGTLMIIAFLRSTLSSGALNPPTGFQSLNLQRLTAVDSSSSIDADVWVWYKFCDGTETTLQLWPIGSTSGSAIYHLMMFDNVSQETMLDGPAVFNILDNSNTITPISTPVYNDKSLAVTIAAFAASGTPDISTDTAQYDVLALESASTDGSGINATMGSYVRNIDTGTFTPGLMTASGATADSAAVSWTFVLRSADVSLFSSEAVLFANGEDGFLYKTINFSNMWQDVAATIPCDANTEVLARIDDLSGNANHALQSVAANQGTGNVAGNANFLSGDWMDTNTRPAAAGTIIVRGVPNANTAMVGSNYNPAANGRVGILRDGSSRSVGYLGNNTAAGLAHQIIRPSGGNPTFPSTWAMSWDGSIADVFFNGYQTDSRAQSGFANTDHNFYLWADNQGGTAASAGGGQHYASIFVNRKLSDREIADVHNYWMIRGMP